MAKTNAASAAERAKAVADTQRAVTEQGENKIAALNAEIQSTRARIARECAAAEAEAESARAQLAKALVASLYAELAPHVSAFRAAPSRAVVNEISAILARAAETCAAQQGRELRAQVLVYAVADTVIMTRPAAVSVFGVELNIRVMNALQLWTRCSPENTAARYDALVALEKALEGDASMQSYLQRDERLVRRYAALRDGITDHQAALNLAAHEREEAAIVSAIQAKNPPNVTILAGAIDLGRRMLGGAA